MPQHSYHVGVFYFMKYKDWSDFKIYCSRINTLMGQPKGFNALSKGQAGRLAMLLAKPELNEKDKEQLAFFNGKHRLYLNPPILSVGAENYLVEIYSRERYGIRRVSAGGLGRSTQAKGFALEKEGLELLSSIDNIKYEKQVEVISNNYLIGVCDAKCPSGSKIVEVKTSWNAANFMKNKRGNFKLPNEIYGQVQGYLDLYKIPNGQVCYVLVNTPAHLIEQEWANLFKKFSYGEITREKYDEGCYKLEGFYDYNKIPEKKRVIKFDIQYSPAYMAKAKTKVDMARLWLNDFEKRFMSTKNIQTNPELYINSQETDNNEESEATI